MPILKFFNATDVSDPFLGVKCFRVDKRVEGLSWKDLVSARKVAALIEELFP